jgi:choline dehydrogenase-like flavoprotein
MIIDLDQAELGAEVSCDIAVVGAGAVGIVMAVELARAGVDVLLLEGGGKSLETSSQALMEAYSVGHTLDGLQNARFRLLGGATNFWGGQLVRFDPVVFEPRPWIGSAGWPLDRVALDPYYDRCARLLGLPDRVDDQALWERLRISPPELDEDLELFLARWLPDPILAQVFQTELAGPTLRAMVHANAVRLEHSGESGRITGLQVRSLGGRSCVVRARQVVLACGTVETLKLLMQPSSDGAPAPWSSNAWLGKGFLEHPDCIAGTVRVLDKSAFDRIFDNIYIDRLKYSPRIKLGARGQLSDESIGISAHLMFNSAYGEHLVNLKLFIRSILNGRWPSNIGQVPAHLAALWQVFIPLADRYLRSHRAFNPSDAGIDLVLMTEQYPNADSRIRLRGELDALGMRKVEVEWVLGGREVEAMARFSERVRTALLRLGLADVVLDPLLAARDPQFLGKVHDCYHQMGGARMGASPNEGVVDANLNVYGAPNLYVAGACVYPSSGFANPTYTAMALGLRLCDHLMAA